MLRKLRRLRVPVCFYTCCSLCAILLFVSFNEDVKNLIQQHNVPRGSSPSGSNNVPPNFPPSFSSFTSLASSGNGNARPMISSSSAGLASVDTHHQSDKTGLTLEQQAQKGRPIQPVEPSFPDKDEDGDVVKRYITDNFVGHPPAEESQQEKASTVKPPQQQNTNVISNLVKLAQQASNNPSAFSNINSLTGDEVVGSGAFGGDNELTQAFMETQGTTSDTELVYPGGDASSPVRKRERQWFMSGGDYFPTPPGGLASIFYPPSSWSSSQPSKIDYANLWYDNNVGSDRVIEQLMFAIDDPINYSNISWGFEGSTATTVKSSASVLTKESERQQRDKDVKSTNNHNTGSPSANNVAHKNVLSSRHTGQLPSQYELVPSSSSGRHGGSYMASGSAPSTLRDPRLGKIKTILLYYGLGMSWGAHVTNGRQVFLQQKCPINACRLTGNRAHLNKADVVLFKDVFMHPKIKRPPNQLWVMYMLECPLNTQNFLEKNAFNLTATYRHDSDIVTPYEKWVYFEDSIRSLPQAINYAEGKTKKVAWFVSNCVAKNNRLEYARELAKYIEVDIYGACGSHTCSRANARQCFEMLSKNYKFYLAFENSNCRDYISEKFFVNGLGNDVLPIVMGAHPDDYKRVAPDRSYIHVDDFSSPKELAQYLHELDTNDDLYNEYFKWKGTGEFINTHFFCRLCAMAHYAVRSPRKQTHYEDFNRWWRGPHVCTRQSWRSTPDIFEPENYDAIISTTLN